MTGLESKRRGRDPQTGMGPPTGNRGVEEICMRTEVARCKSGSGKIRFVTCPYVFVKCRADVGKYSLGSSFLGVPRSRLACAGRLRLWALCGDGAWRDFAEELLVFQHRVDDIASASCQADDCCVVAFSFSAFAFVIPP